MEEVVIHVNLNKTDIMLRLNIIGSFILVIALSCITTTKQKASLESEKISATIDSLLIENEITGLNLSFIDNKGLQRNFSSGFADIEYSTKMEAGHVMFSGSIGKTYCVAAIMKLVDAGKIDLDRKYLDYFPSLDWLNKIPNMDEITIEMLLQHTSGLPRYVMKPGVWEILQSDPDKIWSYKDRLSFIFGDKPVHQTGKGWSYSDTNYILLGMLLEEITGTGYYDYVRREILEPSNLVYTFPADRRDIPGLPAGYSRLPGMFRMPGKVVEDGRYIFNPQMEWTGGGMASTASDLASWAKIYYDGDIIPQDLKALIITPNSQAPLVPGGAGYGMGSFIFDTKHGKAYGHTGFVPGFNAVFAWYPDLGIAIAMQVNCDYAASKMGLMDYLDRVIGVLN